MTQQFFAIAATLHEQGEGHSRYRAELVFAVADDAEAALTALREQVAAQRPGWAVVSTAIRAVPQRPKTTPDATPEAGAWS